MGASLLERGAILPPPDAESLYATKMYAVDLYINIRDQYMNMNVFAVLCIWLLHFLRCGFPEKSCTRSEMELINKWCLTLK